MNHGIAAHHKIEGFKRSDIKKMLNDNSPFAIKEAYNSVRTNLMFTNKGKHARSYVVTSAMPNDGKPLIASMWRFLSLRWAKRPLSLMRICETPQYHQIFGLPLQDGVSEILAGMVTSVNIKPTDYNNLFILTAGKNTAESGRTLSGEKMDILLKFCARDALTIFLLIRPRLKSSPTHRFWQKK
jgi:Mrp family chromosome partitioning ATPase